MYRPCVGDRPVPSCLGGGDLDGDVYNLIPLDELPEFEPLRLSPPADYDPAPKKLLDRPSTMVDVAEFVMEYINSDVSFFVLFLQFCKRFLSGRWNNCYQLAHYC